MTLIDEIRIHPEEGVKRLESECKPGLLALARRLCPDEGDAEELVNRTFAEVVVHIDSLISRPALFGWMCQILVDCHAKDNRRKSRSAETADSATVAAAVDEDAEARLFREVDAGILRDAIEKLFVERRGGVMYGNGYVPFDHDTPVLLGALHVEYASEADTGEEAVRLSRLRMPAVAVAQMPNPIADMTRANPLPAGRIVSVRDPDTWFNGANGDFAFELPGEAVSWEVWAERDKDGHGALKLGRDLRKNPCNVRGFLAGQTFYAFVVWRDKAGRQSKPSAPFEVRLEDHFAHR